MEQRQADLTSMMVSRDSLFCRSTRIVSSEQRRMTPSTPAPAHTGAFSLTVIEPVVNQALPLQGGHARPAQFNKIPA